MGFIGIAASGNAVGCGQLRVSLPLLTDDAFYIDAPAVDTAYGVVVRCSSDPDCTSTLDDVGVTVEAFVDCPSHGFVTGDTDTPAVGSG